ncbi:aminopeptidase [Candidatus Nanosalina sp. VS9-1]|uniref:aminopeptidase n=1 Tax=Candidatus Nanosalina sp. VS9-1 TaxID=3388566 RepID=UPI0039E0D339
MVEERIKEFAEVIVEKAAEVEKGDNVSIMAKSLQALPLFKEVRRQVIDKGAFPYEHLLYDTMSGEMKDYYWMKNASDEQMNEFSEARMEEMENMDAVIKIKGLDNFQELSSIDADRISRWRSTTRDIINERVRTKWVLAAYPTDGLAQQSEMSTEEFEDFAIDAVVKTDWEDLERKNQEIKEIFDAGDTVRIVDDTTDIEISIEGREGVTADGNHNLPDGEVFYAPVKDSLEGHIEFSYPVTAEGNEIKGIRLEFKEGRIVDFSADQNEEFLKEMINTDDGSKYIGELGIGTNRQIDRYIKYTLFDEKIGGTIHMAIGRAYEDCMPEGEEPNESSIHWDIVKDLRERAGGGKIFVDGELVQENGEWVY